jgi:flagellar basal body-associated protein FliL
MNRTPEELDAYMARLRKELEAVEQMKAEADNTIDNKTRNYRLFVAIAIILTTVLAGISIATYPVLSETYVFGAHDERFCAYRYNGEIYKGDAISRFKPWIKYQDCFGYLDTAVIENGTPGVLCEDGKFFEVKRQLFSNGRVIISHSETEAACYQMEETHKIALMWTLIISTISIVILCLYLSISRENRKKLFKDVRRIINKTKP